MTTRKESVFSQRDNQLEPLLVSHPTARRLLDVGRTKYWELVKAGQIETVSLGRRSVAKYSSLKRLALVRPDPINGA